MTYCSTVHLNLILLSNVTSIILIKKHSGQQKLFTNETTVHNFSLNILSLSLTSSIFLRRLSFLLVSSRCRLSSLSIWSRCCSSALRSRCSNSLLIISKYLIKSANASEGELGVSLILTLPALICSNHFLACFLFLELWEVYHFHQLCLWT